MVICALVSASFLPSSSNTLPWAPPNKNTNRATVAKRFFPFQQSLRRNQAAADWRAAITEVMSGLPRPPKPRAAPGKSNMGEPTHVPTQELVGIEEDATVRDASKAPAEAAGSKATSSDTSNKCVLNLCNSACFESIQQVKRWAQCLDILVLLSSKKHGARSLVRNQAEASVLRRKGFNTPFLNF